MTNDVNYFVHDPDTGSVFNAAGSIGRVYRLPDGSGWEAIPSADKAPVTFDSAADALDALYRPWADRNGDHSNTICLAQRGDAYAAGWTVVDVGTPMNPRREVVIRRRNGDKRYFPPAKFFTIDVTAQ